MQLEDHAGDILRKARSMNNLSASALATTAAITEDDLKAFEASGSSRAKLNFSALAKAAGLNPEKFESVVQGWLPAKPDLARWRELRVFTTRDEEMSVNCFLIWDANTRAAALFDTGMDAQPVLDFIATEKLTLQHIFITHSHWDHVEALPKFRAAWPVAQLHSSSPNAPARQRNQPGAVVSLGHLRIAHRETPGHADDGVTYLITGWPDNAPPVAVVGDAIFAGSIGRGNPSWELARQKVREHILSQPLETLICPGHGPLTTVAEEVAHNPFF
jgi:glyoxylase-like metal-dependent hydrolase (beta-lactamase superfamily II)